MKDIFKLTLKNLFAIIMSFILALLTNTFLVKLYSPAFKKCPDLYLDNFDCSYPGLTAVTLISFAVVSIISYFVLRRVINKFMKERTN